MDISSIATASIYMNLSQAKQSADISILKKSMDNQEAASTAILESISASTPSFGHKLDIKV